MHRIIRPIFAVLALGLSAPTLAPPASTCAVSSDGVHAAGFETLGEMVPIGMELCATATALLAPDLFPPMVVSLDGEIYLLIAKLDKPPVTREFKNQS